MRCMNRQKLVCIRNVRNTDIESKIGVPVRLIMFIKKHKHTAVKNQDSNR